MYLSVRTTLIHEHYHSKHKKTRRIGVLVKMYGEAAGDHQC